MLPKYLPREFGGVCKYDHDRWLDIRLVNVILLFLLLILNVIRFHFVLYIGFT